MKHSRELKVDPHKYGQLIFDKRNLKIIFSINYIQAVGHFWGQNYEFEIKQKFTPNGSQT